MGPRITRYLLSLLAAACFVSTGQATNSKTEDYPSKPITFYVGYATGGSADTIGRLILPQLADRIKQPIVIDNRAGAAGVIGLDTVARSTPDGYVMGFGTAGALASNVTLHPNLPYDPLRSFSPVGTVVRIPIVLVTDSNGPFKTVDDVLKAAKTTPVSYGSAGTGSSTHLAGELLSQMTGAQLTHVPYKGTGPAAVDVLGGHLDTAFIDLPTAVPHIRSGRMRILGVTNSERSQLIPDVPTISESGIPGYAFTTWFGIVMPAGTSEAITTYLNRELVTLLQADSVREQLKIAGAEPFISTPKEMQEIIANEIELTRRVIQSAGIKLQ